MNVTNRIPDGKMPGLDAHGIAYKSGNRAHRRHVLTWKRPRRNKQMHLDRATVRMHLMRPAEIRSQHVRGSQQPSAARRFAFMFARLKWRLEQAARATVCRAMGHGQLIVRSTHQPYCMRCRRLL